jgi:hypothetical protein
VSRINERKVAPRGQARNNFRIIVPLRGQTWNNFRIIVPLRGRARNNFKNIVPLRGQARNNFKILVPPRGQPLIPIVQTLFSAIKHGISPLLIRLLTLQRS